MKLTRTLAEAQAQGYIVDLRGSDYKLRNRYFGWCEREDVPYIVIKRKTKYAEVVVDLIGQSYHMTEHAGREVGELLAAVDVRKRHQGISHGNSVILFAERVPIELAPSVAQQIITILAKPGYREPNYVQESDLVVSLDRALQDGTLGADDKQVAV